MDWANVTWDTARAGGFVAYLLLSASVCLGLVLSLGWRTPAWPRFLGRDVHNHLVLLTLVFAGLHTGAIWLDPFMRFTPAEVLVPLVSHYRPLWVALGIVTAYLLLALYFSERLRPWIGWRLWRGFHFVAFPAWALATLHGLGNGSDSQAGWAFALYAAGFSAVAALVVVRVLRSSLTGGARAALAGGTLVLAAAGWLWALQGPAQPGWNEVANNGHGNGSRLAAARTTRGSAVEPTPAAAALALPFESRFTGTAGIGGPDADGLSTLTIDAQLREAPGGTLRLVLQGRQRTNGFAVAAGEVTYRRPSGEAYTGNVVSTRGGVVTAVLTGPGGPFRVGFTISESSGSSLQGEVTAQAD